MVPAANVVAVLLFEAHEEDDVPGLGLTLKTEYLDQFNIIE